MELRTFCCVCKLTRQNSNDWLKKKTIKKKKKTKQKLKKKKRLAIQTSLSFCFSPNYLWLWKRTRHTLLFYAYLNHYKRITLGPFTFTTQDPLHCTWDRELRENHSSVRRYDNIFYSFSYYLFFKQIKCRYCLPKFFIGFFFLSSRLII